MVGNGSLRAMLFGAHVSTAGGLPTAIDRGVELGCRAVQIFPQSPRVWKPTVHSDESLALFRARAAEEQIVAVCHAPYLINLAGTSPDVVEKSEAVLTAAAETGRGMGAFGVIVHIGSHLGSGFDEGLRRATPPLARVLATLSDETPLLLENSAGAGGTMGRTIDELARVIDALDAHPHLCICLDSAHLYGSGVDVGDAEALDAMIDEFDRTIGLDRLRCLHINDSREPLGSNRDRHANLGEGLIGERLSVFLGHPRLQGLPAVMETPGQEGKGSDATCMATLARLWEQGVAAR